MLEAIRERAQGWLAKVILALITIPFALWGIDSYFKNGGKEKPAAMVGKAEITQRTFIRALKDQQESAGGKVQDKVLRQKVMDQLVNASLLSQTATKAGFAIPDGEVQSFIQGLEGFQVDGKFSEAKLDAFLRNRGMSPAELYGLVVQDQLIKQIEIGYGAGAMIPRTSADRFAALLAQKREVNEVVFDAKQYLGNVHIDDKAVEAEYNAHKNDYSTPAQARVQYVTLSQNVLEAGIQIGEDKARAFFEANPTRFQEPEQRNASHILIKLAPDADAKARAEAKAKADKIFAEASKEPARFAELARQYSQDPGSADKGGNLGQFTRDAMVKPFAEAVFGMKPGEVRGPVESQFGYHIILLNSVIAPPKVSFDTVKPAIMQELKQQDSQRRFVEAADKFSNLVYERPETLEPAAKEFGLKLEESGWITQKPTAPGPLSNPRLLESVFSDDSVKKRQNIEAVEVAPNTLVSARVIDYKPSGVRPFAEVSADIRAKLSLAEAKKLAVAAGAKALEAARAGQAVTGLSAPMTMSRMQSLNTPQAAIRAVFRVDPAKLPAYTGVETPDGFHIYRVNSVAEGSMEPAMAERMRTDLRRLVGQEEMRALLEYIRARNKVEISPGALEAKTD